MTAYPLDSVVTASQGSGGAISSPWYTVLTNGTAILGTGSNPLIVSGSGVFSITGTVGVIGPVSITSTGSIPVTIVGGGGGGTSQADRSSFVDGLGSLTPFGGVFNETSVSPSEDQVASVRITAARGIHTNIRDSSGVELGIQTRPIRANASDRVQAVHTNATVTSAGSTIFTGFGEVEIVLVINVKSSPTGTAPRLSYTIQEVDEGDGATLVGPTLTSDPIGTIGTRTLRFFSYRGAVRVSWTVTGTTPSFTGVYATITVKQSGAPYGRSQWDYTPSPYASLIQPFVDETVPFTVDGGGQLVTRGDVLTDEGSFRYDFGGNTLDFTIAGTLTFTNGSATVTGIGTDFANELGLEYIRHGSDNSSFGIEILRVISATELLLSEPYGGTSGASATAKAAPMRDISPTKNGSISYNNSIATLSPGTGNGNAAILYRSGDYLPVTLVVNAQVSTRNNNTTGYIGLVDDATAEPANWEWGAYVTYDGTLNTVIKFTTKNSSAAGDNEATTITLPNGLTTASQLNYNIDISGAVATLLVNGVVVAQHTSHIPDPYYPMDIILRMSGGGATAGNLLVDNVYWNNANQIEVANNFTGTPVNTRSAEEVLFVTGILTTSATTADQTIISFTVPVGKLMFISGLAVGNNSATVNGTPVKLGKGTIVEPAAPGVANGDVFRTFYLRAGDLYAQSFAGRKFAVGGDVVKVVVTPSANTSTVWRATLEYSLR